MREGDYEMRQIELKKVERKVIETFSMILGEEANISQDGKIKDLDIVSMDFIKIVVALETAFDFEFDDDKLNVRGFTILQDLINYIYESINE